MSRTIVIVGGGASGALLAVHLARQADRPGVVVVEPRAEIGPGLAYSTRSPGHLLNVRAANMSAFPDRPDHFLDWLRRDHDPEADGGLFAPRMAYGRYLRSLAQAAGIVHCRTMATAVTVERDAARLVLADGTVLGADHVVLALGHFPPVDLPHVSDDAVARRIYYRDPWADHAPMPDRDAPVVLIGTGLTAVDMLLRLREEGHRGPVTMISRHGLPSLGHIPCAPCAQAAIPPGTAPAARAYLRALHAALRDGVAWPAAIDSLRGTSNLLWARLPLSEKIRFRRHLFHRWSVARHRMAPSVAARVAHDMQRGTLAIRRGHVHALAAGGDGGVLTLRTARGTEILAASRVINCSGPATDYRHVGSALLRGLLRTGQAVPGEMGVTLATGAGGAVRDAAGHCSPVLSAMGPMRAGTLFETTAIPEIRQQAAELAARLVRTSS